MKRFDQLNHLKLIRTLVLLVGIALAACGQNTAPTTPPWALGDGIPEFKGTIVYWAKGDAIAPADGGIFATTYAGDPEGISIGFGSIKTDGGFTFGLQRGASSAGGGVAAGQALCTGLTLSNPQQKIAVVEILDVLARFEEGKHARPGGGILISTTHPITPTNPQPPRWNFIYASQDGSIKGSCSFEEVGTVTFDLDFRKGWNTVKQEDTGLKTAAIPSDAKWYFINPLTALP